jgi:hypothetical protein
MRFFERRRSTAPGTMPKDEPSAPDEQVRRAGWEVICIECYAIKRDGQRTLHRATTITGKSTGYCDACFSRTNAAPSPYREE